MNLRNWTLNVYLSREIKKLTFDIIQFSFFTFYILQHESVLSKDGKNSFC